EKITLKEKEQILKSLQEGVSRKNEESKLINEAISRLEVLGYDSQLAEQAVKKIVAENDSLDLAKLVQNAFTILNSYEDNNIKDEKDLRTIIENGKAKNLTAYESLLQYGFIKNDYPENGVAL